MKALLLTLLLMTGCSSTPILSEKIVGVPVDCGVVPKWDVLVLDNVSPFSIKNAAGDAGVHFTPEEYKIMGKNWQGVKKFMRQSNTVVEFYIDCIDKHNVRVDEQNKEPPVTSEKSFTDKLKFWK